MTEDSKPVYIECRGALDGIPWTWRERIPDDWLYIMDGDDGSRRLMVRDAMRERLRYKVKRKQELVCESVRIYGAFQRIGCWWMPECFVADRSPRQVLNGGTLRVVLPLEIASVSGIQQR